MDIIILHVGNTDVGITGWFLVLSLLGLLGGISRD